MEHRVMKDTVIGITVIGKDRGGIVAAFTNFVFFRAETSRR